MDGYTSRHRRDEQRADRRPESTAASSRLGMSSKASEWGACRWYMSVSWAMRRHNMIEPPHWREKRFEKPVRLIKSRLYANARFIIGSGKNATIHKHQSLYILRSISCSRYHIAMTAVFSRTRPTSPGSSASCQLPVRNPSGT
jgi:hypothetical protein